MLAFEDSPTSVLLTIATRAVARRLALGWTRAELAERAGVAIDTLKRFEQTGQVSLARLLRVAMALDAMSEFALLFPEASATSLAELEALEASKARKRGRSRGRRRTAVSPTFDAPKRDALESDAPA